MKDIRGYPITLEEFLAGQIVNFRPGDEAMWPEITRSVNAEGFRMITGEQYYPEALRAAWERAIRRNPGLLAWAATARVGHRGTGDAPRSEATGSPGDDPARGTSHAAEGRRSSSHPPRAVSPEKALTPEAVKPFVTPRAHSEAPYALDEKQVARELMELMRSEGFLERTGEIPPRHEAEECEATLDIPPKPERVKDRKWKKLAGTIDEELYKLFQEKRNELGLSVSAMLDLVVWNAFGKPPLSFEAQPAKASDKD